MSPSRLSDCGFNCFWFVSKMTMVFHRRIGNRMVKVSQTHIANLSILCVILLVIHSLNFWSRELQFRLDKNTLHQHNYPETLLLLRRFGGGNQFFLVPRFSRFTVGKKIAEKDDVLHRAGKSGGSYLYVSWNGR